METLRKQFLRHVAQTSPSPMLVEVERAEGSCFYTPEGKRYYDLIAGVSVSNAGHNNSAVTTADELRTVSEELLAATDLGGHRVRLIGLTVGNSPEACTECVQLRFDFDFGGPKT